MFADFTTFLNYNANMRSLMYDNLKSCELLVVNRTPYEFDMVPIHKIVRGANRGCDIAYEHEDSSVTYDNIEDPLPYDVNADIIEIADRDYAYWYRDLAENPDTYDGKKVRFTGIVAKNPKLPKKSVVTGRHVMTCCVDDIAYAGLLLMYEDADKLNTRDWIEVTASVEMKYTPVYATKGPVLTAISVEPTDKPDPEVASFD